MRKLGGEGLRKISQGVEGVHLFFFFLNLPFV